MTSLHTSTDFPMPAPDDQLFWSASLGLDLADRTVLEAEVLVGELSGENLRLFMRRSSNLVRELLESFHVGRASKHHQLSLIHPQLKIGSANQR